MTRTADALSIIDAQTASAAGLGGTKSRSSHKARRSAVLIGIGVAACGVVFAIDAAYGFRPHAPRLGLLLTAPAVLQLHIAAAVLAFAIGFALLVGVKGRRLHRTAGWAWVVCMMTVVATSFWIRDHGRFSYIHFLSGWVSISVPMAVAAAKRHDVRRHRAIMTNIFMGGLVVAGAFTFVPGRLMWRIFVG